MQTERFSIRPAHAADLEAINAVIETCVMGWNLPPRVKRLALGSYLYSPSDLGFMELLLAVSPGDEIAGIAALEPADAGELPEGHNGLLLHGLYVSPELQGHGIGTLLVAQALDKVRIQGLGGLLVKAQNDATGFFDACGFQRLPVSDTAADYANRWWKPA